MRHHLSTVLLAAWDARCTRKRRREGLFSHCAGVDIRCHAFSHQYRVIKLNSPQTYDTTTAWPAPHAAASQVIASAEMSYWYFWSPHGARALTKAVLIEGGTRLVRGSVRGQLVLGEREKGGGGLTQTSMWHALWAGRPAGGQGIGRRANLLPCIVFCAV